MIESDPPIVVYHVAALGDWRNVVVEQFRTLGRAGLRDVRITHVGPDVDWLMAQASRQGIRATLVRTDPNTMHYETFGIFEVERIAREDRPDRAILYFHTKGVSRPELHAKRLWRRLMDHHVLRKWRENIARLAVVDAVGVNWFPCEHPHFAGNYWFARPDWIRKLPDYTEFHNRGNRERFTCEWWIGSVPNIRAHSLVCQGEYWGDDRESHFAPRIPVDENPPEITWVSGATRGYEADLARLLASCQHLGDGHRFQFIRWDASTRFRHTLKFDLLRESVLSCKTSHLFWIDADCEFAEPILPWELTGKPLTAVRHFGSNGAREYLPRHLNARITWPIPNYSWQSCLFGGTVEAVADQMARLAWMDKEGHEYDEHGLVMDWSRRPDDVLTLPCRYATPTTFAPFPTYEPTYQQRAGGPTAIRHHNRALEGIIP